MIRLTPEAHTSCLVSARGAGGPSFQSAGVEMAPVGPAGVATRGEEQSWQWVWGGAGPWALPAASPSVCVYTAHT